MKRGFLKNVKPREKPLSQSTNSPAGTATGKKTNSNVYNLPYGKGVLDGVEASPLTPLLITPSTAKAPPLGGPATLEVATIPFDPPSDEDLAKDPNAHSKFGSYEMIPPEFQVPKSTYSNRNKRKRKMTNKDEEKEKEKDMKTEGEGKNANTNQTGVGHEYEEEEDDTAPSTTQFLYYPPTKHLLLAAPGYPQPIHWQPVGLEPVKYEIKEAEGMGVGVFARKDIASGELIFVERPLLVVPMGMVGVKPDVNANANANADPKTETTKDQWLKSVLTQWEFALSTVVGRMDEEDRKSFMKLGNCHQGDGSGEVLGRVRSNGYEVLELAGEKQEGVPEGALRYTCVGKTASRINHSCIPNTRRVFSLPSFTISFTATRPIPAGAQILTSYCSLFASKKTRATELARYGFKCGCEACEGATGDRDAFRASFVEEVERVYKMSKGWATGKDDTSKKITSEQFKALLELQKHAIEEGFDSATHYIRILSALVFAYGAMGLKEKAGEMVREVRRRVGVCREVPVRG